MSSLYAAMDYAMIRAPSLPIDALPGLWLTGQCTDFEEYVSTNNPLVNLAILISSPSLYSRLRKQETGGGHDPRLSQKINDSLIRMATRPTPFGLYAGIGICRFGGQTDISLSGGGRTRTRLDMEWLTKLVENLIGDPEIIRNTRWLSNSAVLLRGGRAFLSSPENALGETSISYSRPVQIILENSHMPVSYMELEGIVLRSIKSATPEKFYHCLTELKRLKFVYSELTPPIVDSADRLTWIIDHLPSNRVGECSREALKLLRAEIIKCDEVPFRHRADQVQRCMASAQQLVGTASSPPLQMDLSLDLNGNTLSHSIGREAARAAELLINISGVSPKNTSAAKYYEAFIARYGSDCEVPFLELAHPEWGLGLQPLFQLDAQMNGGVDLRTRDQILQELVQSALLSSSRSIELSRDVINSLIINKLNERELPTSLEMNLILLAKSVEDIDSGVFKVMVGPNVGAMKAGRHFARFGHMFPEAISELVQSSHQLEAERDRSVDLVELTFLPNDARLANVVLRLPCFDAEANYGVPARSDEVATVRFDELLVGVKDRRIYVRRAGSQRRLIFTMDCMLNSNRAPRECQVLLALTAPPVTQLSGFQWGSVANGVFLPRLTSGRIILHCAQWRISARQIPSKADFAAWLSVWRSKWLCPRYVYVCSGDHRLLRDLDDIHQAQDLFRRISQDKDVILQEPLPHHDDAWLAGPTGHHVAEVIVPLRLRNRTAPSPSQENQILPREAAKSFVGSCARLKPPGSDWLYIKLYVPQSMQDSIIAGPLQRLCCRLSASDRWFFVRYADPHPHLRIRFRSKDGASSSLLSEVCSWAQSLLDLGMCSSFCFDTYVREIERYGGESIIDHAEQAFCADSIFTAEVMSNKLISDPILQGVQILDKIIDFAGFSVKDKLEFLKNYVDLTPDDGRIFRTRKASFVAEVDKGGSLPFGSMSQQLSRQKAMMVDFAEALHNGAPECLSDATKHSVLRSLLHMHCNRLWGLDQNRELTYLRLLRRRTECLRSLPR